MKPYPEEGRIGTLNGKRSSDPRVLSLRSNIYPVNGPTHRATAKTQGGSGEYARCYVHDTYLQGRCWIRRICGTFFGYEESYLIS